MVDRTDQPDNEFHIGQDNRSSDEEDKNENEKQTDGKVSKKVTVPASAYHKIGRQNNQVITEGILSARSKTISQIQGQLQQNEQVIDLQRNLKSQEAQKILTTSIQVQKVATEERREGNKEHLASNFSKHQKSLIDHSQLFVQNSPRQSIGANPTITAGVHILRIHQQQQQLSTVQSNLLTSNARRSTTPAEGMNPVFDSTDCQEKDTFDRTLNVERTPVFKEKPKIKSNNIKNGKINTSQPLAQGVNNSNGSSIQQEGQYADMINGMNKDSKAFQDMRQKSSLYKKGQAENGVTQLLLSHQEGSEVQVIPSPIMQVNIQERPQPPVLEVKDTHANFSIDIENMPMMSHVNHDIMDINNVSVYGAINQLQQTSINEYPMLVTSPVEDEFYKIQQFTNPFNVQSFTTKAPFVNKKNSNDDILPSPEPYKNTSSGENSPIRVQSHRETGSPSSPRKGSEHFIKQVMEAPKMTNYKVLKRPKTNRDSLRLMNRRQSDTKAIDEVQQRIQPSNGTFLQSTKGHSQVQQMGYSVHKIGPGTIDSQNSVTKQPQQQQFYRSGNGGQSMPVTQQGKRQRRGPENQIMKSIGPMGQRLLVSQGSLTQPNASNAPTSPSRVSKKYAGGFGGVGSIYTQSHITKMRKHSHYRMTQGGQSNDKWPPPITPAGQHVRLSSQEAIGAATHQQSRVHNSSANSIDDLIVAGTSQVNTPDYSYEPAQQFKQADLSQLRLKDRSNLLQTRNVGNPSGDTSRSPIPIDPESYKNMNMQLPTKMYASSNNLRASRENISHNDRSMSISSSRNEDKSQFRQVKTFIMSPQNLQETLKRQQDAIRAGIATKNGSQISQPNPKSFSKNPSEHVSPRNAVTQHGKRSRANQNSKLNPLIMQQTDQYGKTFHYSQTNSSYHQSGGLKGSSKRLRKSTDNNGNIKLSTLNNVNQSQHHLGQAFTSQNQMIIPRIEGHQFRGTITGEADLTQESYHRKFKSNQLQSNKLIYNSSGLNNKNGSPKQDIQGAADTSIVPVRVNKINIAVHQQQLAGVPRDSVTNTVKSACADGTIMEQQEREKDINRVHMNLSQFSNFVNPNKDRVNLEEDRGKFRPVLKSKSYLVGLDPNLSQPQVGDVSTIHEPKPISPEAVYINEPVSSSNQTSRLEQNNDSKHADASAQLAAEEPTIDGPIEEDIYEMDKESLPRLVSKPNNQFPPHDSRTDQSELSQVMVGIGYHSSQFNNMTPNYGSNKRQNELQNEQNNTTSQDEINSDIPSDEGYMNHTRFMVAAYRNQQLEQRSENDGEGGESDVDPRVLKQLLKKNQKSWAQYTRKDFGALDSVATKTYEFMEVQRKLGSLDYNSMNSERTHVMDNKVDLMMKDIALTGRKKYSMMPSPDGSELFDVSQRKSMHIKMLIPMNVIKFKNKSEQTRYLRIVTCIIGLNDSTLQKSQNDIEFTYTKIFRFLADMLTPKEFEGLSYYHVSRFISNTLKMAYEDGQSEMKDKAPQGQESLRQFIYKSLELQYRKTAESRDMLSQVQFNMKDTEIKKIWSKVQRKNAKVDPYDVASEKDIMPYKQRSLRGNPEARHQQIQDSITQSVKCFAHEPSMNTVISSTYYQQKETIKRENLARLLKYSGQSNDLDHKNLNKMSALARNSLVIEHVLAERNLRDWKVQVLEEIHGEQNASSGYKRTQSQGTQRCDKNRITKRIL